MNIGILNLSMLYALIVGAAIGGVAGYIGSLMVTKRMALMADAFVHLTLPGVALALRYHFDISVGALLFLYFGLVIIWLLEKYTQLPVEALTSLVFTTSLAIAFLFLPEEESHTALLGDIAQISFTTFIITLLGTILVFFSINFIYKKLVLISISRDLAQIQGINITILQLIYLTSIGLIIALGVRIIGGLMTSALVAIPACTSRNISYYMTQYAVYSFLIGSFACCAGILISFFTNIPVGPSIILVSSTSFFISIFLPKLVRE